MNCQIFEIDMLTIQSTHVFRGHKIADQYMNAFIAEAKGMLDVHTYTHTHW